MKRIFFGISLSCAVLLLSACPDSKMPTPSPKVPEPKALGATPATSERIPARSSTFAELPPTTPY